MAQKQAERSTSLCLHKPFTIHNKDPPEMTTQKALWLPWVGAEFTLGKTNIPEPGPGKVLIKLEWKIKQSGFSMIKEYPAIVGQDGVGIIQKVSNKVTNLSLGDKVLVVSFQQPCHCTIIYQLHTVRSLKTSFGNKYSTYQEYFLMNAALIMKVSCYQICISTCVWWNVSY